MDEARLFRHKLRNSLCLARLVYRGALLALFAAALIISTFGISTASEPDLYRLVDDLA
ncbi:MAG: hypothetical protein HPY30_08370 [Gammaproteobacteria bacterium (ex Lamellibrachia satsuma)]|nr:MAG: hypothetical protein HPY30_08370 [Gammaproteobacteria bacterium (ex Lamellibrachia satsuma)]